MSFKRSSKRSVAKKSRLNYAPIAPFPSHIPLEIGRHILEIAASLDDYTTALSLVTSCKLFRDWIEPILYHTIVIYSNHQWRCLRRTINDRLANDSLFFTRNVKRILVDFPDDFELILNTCKGLVSMVFWGWDWDNEEPDHSPESAVSKRQSFLRQYADIPTASRLTLDFLHPAVVPFLPGQLTHLTLITSEDPPELDFKALFATCRCLSRLLLVIMVNLEGEYMTVWHDFAQALLTQSSSPQFRLLILAPGLGPWRVNRLNFTVRRGYRNVWIRRDDPKEPRLMIVQSDYMTENSDGSEEEGNPSDSGLTAEERSRRHDTTTTETFRRIARLDTDAWDFAAEHGFC